MTFDGIFTHYIVKELNENILNGRINKIYQVSNYELVFVVRANQKTSKLLLSINPNYARIHITEEDYTNPQEPPMFCMLLRKHLEGGLIINITQKDNDRIIEFQIEHINEIGDKEVRKLIVEIMGKHSNIILVNNETDMIIDSIKHVSPFLNSFRTLQPGAVYVYPPTSNKINFFKATKEDYYNLNYSADLVKQLVDYFEGISPLCAKEILHNAIINPEGLYQSYLSFIETVEKNLIPCIIHTPQKDFFYLCHLKHLYGEIKTFKTLGEMLDRFYFNKETLERIKQQTQDLEKFIKNEYDKYINKLNNLETDLMIANDALIYKTYGDLIIANSYDLEKGKTSLRTINYEDDKEITIELDPLLTPLENAKKYYSRYQKAKKAIGHIEEQIMLTREEIAYFEVLLEQMQNASLNDALEIRQELEVGGYLKKQLTKQRKSKKPQYEHYVIDNTDIYVGKNNLQNEYITHKLANKNDYFMHVKDMPGSHVIIKNEGKLTENIIRGAAKLAAYYSKGRMSSSVPVDYTLVKHVKKVHGSKLGYVTYDNQKTIYIDPDEDFIHRLKKI